MRIEECKDLGSVAVIRSNRGTWESTSKKGGKVIGWL